MADRGTLPQSGTDVPTIEGPTERATRCGVALLIRRVIHSCHLLVMILVEVVGAWICELCFKKTISGRGRWPRAPHVVVVEACQLWSVGEKNRSHVAQATERAEATSTALGGRHMLQQPCQQVCCGVPRRAPPIILGEEDGRTGVTSWEDWHAQKDVAYPQK